MEAFQTIASNWECSAAGSFFSLVNYHNMIDFVDAVIAEIFISGKISYSSGCELSYSESGVTYTCMRAWLSRATISRTFSKKYKIYEIKSRTKIPAITVMNFFALRCTAILSCRYGPHEKSWKIGLGPLDLKSRPSPHCWVRRNSRETTNFHFGPVEGCFPGQRTTTKAPSLHTNCNWLRPQGLKLRPQGLKAFLPNVSTWLRHLLADFDEWT